MTTTRTQNSDHVKTNFYSSFIAATINAGAFHTWNRAIFLSLINQRAFFLRSNFANPLQGLAQTLTQKPLTGWIYYFAQSELGLHLTPYLQNTFQFNESEVRFAVGSCAGSIDAIVKQPFFNIKARTTNEANKAQQAKTKYQKNFWQCANEMRQQGGIKSFANGTLVTVTSYAVWGSSYEWMRFKLYNAVKQTAYAEQHPLKAKFASDATAASCATVACSLFSYVRTMKTTEPDVTPPSAFSAVKTLFQKTNSQPTPNAKAKFFLNSLKLGPSTVAVAASMALGQEITDLTKNALTRFNRSS